MFFACSAVNKQPDKAKNEFISAVVSFDTLQKAHIDTITYEIKGQIRQIGKPQKLVFPAYSQSDTIYYWVLMDGKSACFSINWHINEKESIWPTFFVYDGQLIHARLMHSDNTPGKKSVSESMTYLEDGKIIWCEERGGSPNENERPMVVRMRNFTKSTKSYNEIEEEVIGSWEKLYDFMKKENAMPSTIKR